MQAVRPGTSPGFIPQALGLFLSLAFTACVGTSTTLQTAPTTGKGKVVVSAGASVPVSTRFVGELADQVSDATQRAREADTSPLREDEQRDLLKAALTLLVLQPGLISIVEGRYGVTEKLDVGLKWSGPALRVGGKYWLNKGEGGWDASLAAGYTHHTGIGASVAENAFALFEDLRIADYSRRDLDAALLLSSDRKARFGIYAAVRYALGLPRAEVDFSALMTEGDSLATIDDRIDNLGGTAGLRLSAGPVQLMVELSVTHMRFSPTLLDEEVDLSGYLIEPAAGASFTF